MQRSILILLSLSACALAAPQQQQGRSLQGDPSIARILKATQQQTVDGSYGFAYVSDNGQTRNEVSNNGVVEGSYSYFDADGIERKVKYTAGPEGFVVDADHIPKPPQPQPAAANPKRAANPAPRPQQQFAPAPRPQQQFAPAPRPQQQFAPQQFAAPQQQFAPRPQQQFAPINSFPQDFKNARAIGREPQAAPTAAPSPIEQAQLAEQQRLLQENIKQHQQFIADVAAGKHQPATSAAAPAERPPQFGGQFQAGPPRFSQPQFAQPQFARPQQQQRLGVQDFRSLQIPAQQLVGQPGSFRAPANASPFQFNAAQNAARFQPQTFQGPSAPRFGGAGPGGPSAFQPQQFRQQAPQAPFQFAQQPGLGFNFAVRN